MTETALTLVDIQNDYFANGNWPVAKMAAASASAASLLEHARKSGQLVVHVHHEIPSDETPFLRPGTYGARIYASVAPQTREAVILKHHPNSFRETGLLALLQDNGILNVTICGAMSQMCIDATTRAAADFGFDVTVAERCRRRQGRVVRRHAGGRRTGPCHDHGGTRRHLCEGRDNRRLSGRQNLTLAAARIRARAFPLFSDSRECSISFVFPQFPDGKPVPAFPEIALAGVLAEQAVGGGAGLVGDGGAGEHARDFLLARRRDPSRRRRLRRGRRRRPWR